MRAPKTIPGRWPAAALALFALASVTAEPQPPASIPQLLAQLASDADPEANVVLNRRRVDNLTARIERESNARRRFELDLRLSRELLLAGETERAIHRLQQFHDFFDQGGADRTTGAFLQVREWLALAHLRLGEQDNCIDRHASESCLMPIAGGGVHRDPRGSRQAFERYASLLEDFPDDLGYRWLLNLAAMTLGEHPEAVPESWRIPASAFASQAELARFHDTGPQRGLEVVGLSGGVALEDFDGDGWLDVVVSSWGLGDPLRYFRNLGRGADGTVRFSERTQQAGLDGQTGGLNLVHADYDNDGDADVLVLRGAWLGDQGRHPNSLLRNRGDGTFEDFTRQAGLFSLHPTQTAAWGDFDNDGWLDLFIGNESSAASRHPCELYRNRGGRGEGPAFDEVAERFGVAVEGFVKGVAWGDYDNDGRIDLYVSRLGEPNLLYHNEGDEGFREVAALEGVAGPRMSFPTWFWDYDNDGWTDLLAAPFSGFLGESLAPFVAGFLGHESGLETVHLYRNRGRDGGGPTFVEVAAETGLGVPLLAMGASYGDLDNDGFPDAYFGTGEPSLATLVPNRMFRNLGGVRFADVTTAGGFGHLQKGHGIAFGDVDRDGDQDVYAVMGGAYSGDVYADALFENPGAGRHWTTLRLVGGSCNRTAMGARIRVRVDTAAGRRDVYATVGTGGSFGSSSLQQEVGLGEATAVESVTIDWPGEVSRRTYRGLPLDRTVTLYQAGADRRRHP